MRNLWTITQREVKAYFASPVAYVISAAVLVMMGVLFVAILIQTRDSSLRPLFSNMFFLFVIFAPALTMKQLAEEQRMGTIELLLTSPVHDWQVVLGKFLGSFILFVVMWLVPTLFYVLILQVFGSPDYGSILSAYLGFLLIGAACLAIGMFASSLTQNQAIAYIVGAVGLLLMWISDVAVAIVGSGTLADVMSYLALPRHFNEFFQGLIDTTNIVYALSVITIFLFLATQVLQSRRWR